MTSERGIKRRIKSVSSTRQITKAMNLISAAKMQKAKQRLLETKPFMSESARVISVIVSRSGRVGHPFIKGREPKKSLVIVISGDRGLCGGYNLNICKAVHKFIKQKPEASIVAVGAKARDYFKRRGVPILETFTGMADEPVYAEIRSIVDELIRMYLKGDFDEIYLAYTVFESTLSHVPRIMRVLPVDMITLTPEEKKDESMMNYEPSEESVLEYIVPKYIATLLFGAIIESAACELGARMTAMDSATGNADGLIEDLTLMFNRARQGSITQEINEIVSGANTL